MAFEPGVWVKWKSDGVGVPNTGFMLRFEETDHSMIWVHQISGDDNGEVVVDLEFDKAAIMLGTITPEDYDVLIDMALVMGDRDWFASLSKRKEMLVCLIRATKLVKGML